MGNSPSHFLGVLEANNNLIASFLICCYCSVAKSCSTLCHPMNCSTSGFPVLHYLPESAQTYVHWICDAIQPSHPLSPSSPALNLCQHQNLFQWVSSSHQVAKVLELQLLHQSFQWIFRIEWFDILAVQRLSRVFPNTTVQKHQFFGAWPSLWSNTHIHTWLLEKP